MKAFLFQTLFFIIISQSAGLMLNIFWFKEPLPEVIFESLFAGIGSSLGFSWFSKAYKRRQEAPEKESTNR